MFYWCTLITLLETISHIGLQSDVPSLALQLASEESFASLLASLWYYVTISCVESWMCFTGVLDFVGNHFTLVNEEAKSDVHSQLFHLVSQALLALLLCIHCYNWLGWYISCQYNSIDFCLTFLSPVGTCLLGCDMLVGFFFHIWSESAAVVVLASRSL